MSSCERTQLLEKLRERYDWKMIFEIQDLYHKVGENIIEHQISIEKDEKRISELVTRQNELQHKEIFF